jgi:transcriptional regulator with XRE-family HTH domain
MLHWYRWPTVIGQMYGVTGLGGMAMRRTRLVRARRAAGFTQESLAEALRIDRSTVHCWESGKNEPLPYMRPRLSQLLNIGASELESMLAPEPPAQLMITPSNREASLATEREPSVNLPTVVGVASLGGVAPSAESDRFRLSYASSVRATVDAVADLGRMDVERRQFLASAVFSVAASVAPSRDWLVATLEESNPGTGRVSDAQVEAIRQASAVFNQLDVSRGGGHARVPLANYLKHVVVPLLQTNDPETATGRLLYTAASEQLYLLGWMAFDNAEQVMAQGYLVHALGLAKAAKNIELGAHVLAGLSDQATLMGYPDHGVQLARTGVAGLERGNSPACLARLRVLQARAQAAMGDTVAATRSVHLSEQAWEAIQPENEPEWARFIDAAYLNGEYAHTFRNLGRSAKTAMFAQRSADEAAMSNRARRGVLANAALARAALYDHDLGAATAAATKAATLASTVQSSRSSAAVSDLRTRLQPHLASSNVRAFFEQIDGA